MPELEKDVFENQENLSSDMQKEIFSNNENIINLIQREQDVYNDLIDEDKEEKDFAKEIDIKKQSIDFLYSKRYNQNTKLRNKLACWAQDLVSTYLVLVFFLICLNHHLIKLSDEVLITLLGTTTINVLGLMYIAMKDLFNGRSEDKK
ncbi:hypothetical protein MG290_01960 [Flavobacterium sp. CBA20B-1]|uniref:hypothetical protein n=1 Tax=unclassified Flavobacterium TaxID=196869 RepID=UPI0022246B45|nr:MULTISPECIES: hypothetical protein [unclassified Flavobacterium]WCM42460.1 hypothetical protein MG290_01960 [Flavobacterium sp. CBA20B-1]